jgi:hypothetical protein
MRGLAHAYGLANEAKTGLKTLRYGATSRVLATLAWKNQRSRSKANARIRHGKDLPVLGKTKEGRPTRYTRFTRRDWKPPQPKEDVDKMPATAPLRFGRSTLEHRLTANLCESCGKEGGAVEVHHGRKLKDLQGKQWWEHGLSSRKRKTMILCIEGHDLLHAHTLSTSQKKL